VKISTAKKFDNTNRFVLFVNDRKDRDEAPDRVGALNVNGAECYLDGWLRKTEDGNLSGTIKPKTEQQPAPQRPVKMGDAAPF
jgi:hypothetical protein